MVAEWFIICLFLYIMRYPTVNAERSVHYKHIEILLYVPLWMWWMMTKNYLNVCDSQILCSFTFDKITIMKTNCVLATVTQFPSVSILQFLVSYLYYRNNRMANKAFPQQCFIGYSICLHFSWKKFSWNIAERLI